MSPSENIFKAYFKRFVFKNISSIRIYIVYQYAYIDNIYATIMKENVFSRSSTVVAYIRKGNNCSSIVC